MDSAPTTAGAGELLTVPVEQLARHPANLRFDVTATDEETAAARHLGILQPLIVVPAEEGGYRILFGHRRLAIAQAAHLAAVPCVVRHDLTAAGTGEQVLRMIVENDHRQGISNEERAAAYAQLAAFPDLTPARIARRTGRTTAEIADAIRAHQLPEQTRSRVLAGSMTLDQAELLAAYETDPKAYQRLLRAADSTWDGSLAHAIAEENHRVAVKAKKAATRAELTSAGVLVITKPKGITWGQATEAKLTDVRTATGRKITPKAHATCPGHAAYIDDSGEAVHVCTDPEENRHTVTGGHQRPMTPAQQAEAAAQEAERLARAEALTAAATVRADHLRALLTARKLPTDAGTPALILLNHATDAGTGHAATVADLLRLHGEATPDRRYAETLKSPTASRLALHLIAHAAAIAEANLAAHQHRWRFRPALAVTWLDWLAATGYTLSPPERSLCEEARASADRTGDPEPEPEQTDADQSDADPDDDGRPEASASGTAPDLTGSPAGTAPPRGTASEPEPGNPEDADTAAQPEATDHGTAAEHPTP